MSGNHFIEQARALDKAATEGPWMLDGPDHMWWGEDDHEHESAYMVTAGPDRTAVAVAHRPSGAKSEGSYHRAARRFDADSKWIAASRTMLPAAVEALARVRELHQPVHPVFNWRTGLRLEEPCETCHGKAGVHECGCWADEDTEYECRECTVPGAKHVLWPCETYQATEVDAWAS